MPLSVAIFWGTWAMPEGTAYAVGAAGTSATCSIQGFVIITCFLAFPFYYASFSVFACKFKDVNIDAILLPAFVLAQR